MKKVILLVGLLVMIGCATTNVQTTKSDWSSPVSDEVFGLATDLCIKVAPHRSTNNVEFTLTLSNERQYSVQCVYNAEGWPAVVVSPLNIQENKE